MTKQQVIDILEAYKPSGNIYNGYNSIEEKVDDKICSLIDEIIESVKREPDNVRCDDMLRRLVEYEFRKINSYPMTITGIEQALNEVPTIQSQQKTGYWFDVGSLSCRCSECGCKNNRESRYCPNCGAKMGTSE